MLGYAADHRDYRLFDLATKRIFASRDVIFYEDTFPYKELNIKPSSIVPLPIVPYTEEQIELCYSSISTSPLPYTTNIAPKSPQVTPVTSGSVHVLRRSSRTIVQPSWLQDFVAVSHEISCFVNKPSSFSFTPHHNQFAANIALLSEAKNL